MTTTALAPGWYAEWTEHDGSCLISQGPYPSAQDALDGSRRFAVAYAIPEASDATIRLER